MSGDATRPGWYRRCLVTLQGWYQRHCEGIGLESKALDPSYTIAVAIHVATFVATFMSAIRYILLRT